MAYAIKKGSDYFNTVLYTGTGSSQNINVGFSPDFTWIKNRSHNDADPYYGVHLLFNTISGAGNRLISSSTATEAYSSGSLTSFNSAGFSIGTDNSVSYSSDSFVSWNWKGGESTVVNTNGTISANVSANPTSGFSIVSYAGVDTPSTNTVGHGLNQAPEVYIIKNRTSASPIGWVFNTTLIDGSVDYMFLNLTNAKADQGSPWNTAPTSTVFTLGANDGNTCNAGDNYIAYCWHSVPGFSKIGSYTGNGSADGPFVYTGFRPAWIMIKSSSITGEWAMYDVPRDLYNPMGLGGGRLRANTSDAETGADSAQYIDFLSNGFKIRNISGFDNQSSATYIYMAFAECPMKYATAR